MVSGFKVIGLSVRTMNASGQSAKDMTMLWGRFFSENTLHKIPNKNSDEILAIYTDYESDFTGAYTAIIGIAVSTLDEIPAGLIGREFQPDNFQKFTAKGVMPQAVANWWDDIWKGNAELNRKYTYDFEVYGNKSQNGENSEVDMRLSNARVQQSYENTTVIRKFNHEFLGFLDIAIIAFLDQLNVVKK